MELLHILDYFIVMGGISDTHFDAQNSRLLYYCTERIVVASQQRIDSKERWLRCRIKDILISVMFNDNFSSQRNRQPGTRTFNFSKVSKRCVRSLMFSEAILISGTSKILSCSINHNNKCYIFSNGEIVRERTLPLFHFSQ